MGFVEGLVKKLDAGIAAVSPAWGLSRQQARAQAQLINQTIKTSSIGAIPMEYKGDYNRYANITEVRELVNRNALAKSILDRLVENAVGNGIYRQSKTGDEQLNKQIEADFLAWASTADYRGFSWLDHQKLAFRYAEIDGDVFCILDEGDSIENPTAKLQLIDAPKVRDGEGTIDGIQIDAFGKPIAYHIVNDIGGEGAFIPATNVVQYAINPELTAKNDIYKAGGLRGTSDFLTTKPIFQSIYEWCEAELNAARLAASMTAFITSPKAYDYINSQPAYGTPATGQAKTVALGPGVINYLDKDSSVTFSPSNHPSTNFTDTFRTYCRLAGAAHGMPLELMLLDYSTSNYSSSRQAYLQAKKIFENKQRRFASAYLEKIFRWWVEQQITAGVYPDTAQTRKGMWVYPEWPYMDPQKEYQAKQMAIDLYETTYAIEAQKKGMEFEEVVRAKAKEIALMKKYGLTPMKSTALTVSEETGTENADGVATGVETPEQIETGEE